MRCCTKYSYAGLAGPFPMAVVVDKVTPRVDSAESVNEFVLCRSYSPINRSREIKSGQNGYGVLHLTLMKWSSLLVAVS